MPSRLEPQGSPDHGRVLLGTREVAEIRPLRAAGREAPERRPEPALACNAGARLRRPGPDPVWGRLPSRRRAEHRSPRLIRPAVRGRFALSIASLPLLPVYDKAPIGDRHRSGQGHPNGMTDGARQVNRPHRPTKTGWVVWRGPTTGGVGCGIPFGSAEPRWSIVVVSAAMPARFQGQSTGGPEACLRPLVRLLRSFGPGVPGQTPWSQGPVRA